MTPVTDIFGVFIFPRAGFNKHIFLGAFSARKVQIYIFLEGNGFYVLSAKAFRSFCFRSDRP